MTYLPIQTSPEYYAVNGTCTTDGLSLVSTIAPNKVGYWWWSYDMAVPGSGGGVITVRADMAGVGTFYNGTADEGGSETMYINHMGMVYFYPGLLGPGNIFYLYVAKAGRPNLTATQFLTWLPTESYRK